MSRNFTNVTGDNLVTSTVPGGLTGPPLSIAFLFNPDVVNVTDTFVQLGTSGGKDGFKVKAQSNVIRVRTRAGGTKPQADTTATFTAGAVAHACGVIASATSRSAFLDGAGKVTNTSSATPAAWLAGFPYH